MADIFLSYKREDREKVRPVVDALQAKGWSVWWDTRIGVGETWDSVIEKELASAKCVVVVWSKLSVDSRWVRSEAHEGLERNCLVPVIIESARPPLAFRLIQSIDLTSWQGHSGDAAFAGLVEGIRGIAGKGGAAVAVQGSTQGPAPVVIDLSDPTRFTKLIEANPRDVRAYIDRGFVHRRNENYDRAIADYTRALEIDPRLAAAYTERGYTYYLRDDYEHAIDDYSRAIELDPGRDVYLKRAKAHYWKKDYDSAVADYTKAVELDPSFWPTYTDRGRAHYWKGDYDRAIADYTKVTELDPTYSWAYVDRGDAHLQKQALERALADYTKATEIHPGNGKAYRGRATVHLLKSDYARAIADYTKAIEIDPKDSWAIVNRGITYESRQQAGDRESAIADYRRVLEIDANDGTAKEALVRLGVKP